MKSFIYRYLPLFLVVAVLLLAVGCTTQQTAESSKLKIYAAVPPVAWLVEQIGGENIDVHVLIQSGNDPHIYEPTPRQLTGLGGADFYMLGSLPFEKRIMERIDGSGAGVKIIDIAAGIEVEQFEQGKDEAEHSHGSNDPHIWLAPHNLKTMAENIAEALRSADPQHGNEYRDNFLILLRKVDDLQKEISAMLKPYKGEAVYVQHPAFGTFLEEFGLRQVSVEGASSEVSARHLNELIDSARAEGVGAIFTQPQFSDRGANIVAEAIGADVRHLDPLATDVLENLRAMATAIRDELAGREN